jgi:hypothetical protein
MCTVQWHVVFVEFQVQTDVQRIGSVRIQPPRDPSLLSPCGTPFEQSRIFLTGRTHSPRKFRFTFYSPPGLKHTFLHLEENTQIQMLLEIPSDVSVCQTRESHYKLQCVCYVRCGLTLPSTQMVF